MSAAELEPIVGVGAGGGGPLAVDKNRRISRLALPPDQLNPRGGVDASLLAFAPEQVGAYAAVWPGVAWVARWGRPGVRGGREGCGPWGLLGCRLRQCFVCVRAACLLLLRGGT